MARAKQRFWTAKELRLVEHLRLQGLTYKEIGWHLGRSLSSVAEACYRNNIRDKFSKPRQRWVDLFSKFEFETINGLARHLGLSPGTVSKARQKHFKGGCNDD
jgi:hypothetical protein